jgi:hypothetical protein
MKPKLFEALVAADDSPRDDDEPDGIMLIAHVAMRLLQTSSTTVRRRALSRMNTVTSSNVPFVDKWQLF